MWKLVAPRAGAWIETSPWCGMAERKRVAPRAGAWIETRSSYSSNWRKSSLPVRERGLKQSSEAGQPWIIPVAPRAGAWIETQLTNKRAFKPEGRSPCGSVD